MKKAGLISLMGIGLITGNLMGTEWPDYNRSSWMHQGTVILNQQESKNLITNGDFSDQNGWNKKRRSFPGWGYYNTEIQFEKNDDSKNLLKLTNIKDGYSSLSGEVRLEKGTKYRLSAKGKTDGKKSAINIYILQESEPKWKTLGKMTFILPQLRAQSKKFISPVTGIKTLRIDLAGEKDTVGWIENITLVELKEESPENLIPDGSFEGTFSGWTIKNASFSKDNINKYNGRSSIKMIMNKDAGLLDIYRTKNAIGDYPCAIARKELDIPIEKNRIYKLSGMAQGDGYNRTFVQLVGNNGDIIQTNRPKHYEWDALYTTFSSETLKKHSDKIVGVELCIHDRTGGVANFDDICLEKVVPASGIAPGNKLLEDFESRKADAIMPIGNHYAPWPETSIVDEKCHEGKHSARIDYNFDSQRPEASFNISFAYTKYKIPTSPLKSIGMWIYGNNSGLKLELLHAYRKPSDPVFINWEGWKYCEFDIRKSNWHSSPEHGLEMKIGNPGINSAKGTIYVDDISVSGIKLTESDALSMRALQSASSAVYLPQQKIDINIMIRNNLSIPIKNAIARFGIKDFYGNTVKEEEKIIESIDPEKEIEVFKINWLPEKKGVYYLLMETLSDNTLHWKEDSFGVMIPNKGWIAKGEESLFWGICPTHLITWEEPYLMGLLGITMARIHHFKSHVGLEDDPYRWSFYDKLDALYRQNGVFEHQKVVCDLNYGGDVEKTEKMVGDIVKHYKDKTKYFTLGGEQDSGVVKRGGDEKQVDEFIRHFKAGQKVTKEISKDAKVGLALLNWYCMYTEYMNHGKEYEFILKWLTELKGLYDYFPYQIRGGYEQLLGYEKVRKHYFGLANIDVPVWANENISNPIMACALFKTLGLQNYTYFCTIDYGQDRTMGIIDINRNPKSTYFVYNTAIKYLGNSAPLGKVELGKDIVAYSFKRDNKFIYCIWTEWEGGKTLPLSTGADNITLIDCMDNHESLNITNGKVDINLKNASPIFVLSDNELKSL